MSVHPHPQTTNARYTGTGRAGTREPVPCIVSNTRSATRRTHSGIPFSLLLTEEGPFLRLHNLSVPPAKACLYYVTHVQCLTATMTSMRICGSTTDMYLMGVMNRCPVPLYCLAVDNLILYAIRKPRSSLSPSNVLKCAQVRSSATHW